jgi:UDP-glucose 4-epimerase
MARAMTWLLTGGAGYIGAHIVRAFQAAGMPVVVLDDLSTGYRRFVPEGVPFVEGSVVDPGAVGRALDVGPVTGVVHLAGWKYAGVSVERPLHFYRENLTGMQTLLEAVVERGIERFVFSGSCSVYGTPADPVVTEDSPTGPESPYGETKLASEWLLRDVARIAPALRHTTLRYFNVVGSGPPELADHSPYNLFPRVFRALERGEAPQIHGDDYPTRDGTCIRDYIHVVDLAGAHVLAARRLDAGEPCAPAYNVGRGEGSTVREVVETMLEVTGSDLEPVVGPRRPGDPTEIVASAALIERDWGWRAERDLRDMVASAWAAHEHAASAEPA